MLSVWQTVTVLVSLRGGCPGGAGGDSIDSTGLVGTSPALLLGSTQLPLQFWSNMRKSALKPRRRDLHEPTLKNILGHDYDALWMKSVRPMSPNESEDEGERKAVRQLRALVNASHEDSRLQLPAELPTEYRELVAGWLVSRATCPIHFTWDDLGPYFWPRFLRRGECQANAHCSWPPGMTCVPGGARNLHVLRLRKHYGHRKKNNNQVWSTPAKNKADSSNRARKKKRRKYRCFWIKVPYPVPEDCVCACAEKETDSDQELTDMR
ncbi:noggin-1-like [Nilaparvata lugens]|uniref:noggin-1-like n=1 Tax=Nilaparvata lugens TaxID=108931 RepID=UPI00193E9CE5|nr:noggin-1-like [Nilaparvata lugens]